MKTREKAASLYAEAEASWSSAIELSVYDDEDVIYPITGLLGHALRADPNHLPSLRLLSTLLMQLGAREEARDFVVRLQALEPNDAEHQEKRRLLDAAMNEEPNRDEMLKWLDAHRR